MDPTPQTLGTGRWAWPAVGTSEAAQFPPQVRPETPKRRVMTAVHVYRSQQPRPIDAWRCDDSLRCAVALEPVKETKPMPLSSFFPLSRYPSYKVPWAQRLPASPSPYGCRERALAGGTDGSPARTSNLKALTADVQRNILRLTLGASDHCQRRDSGVIAVCA